MESLRLNRNKLVGDIPIEIGQCIHLRELRLDENELTGEIPDVSFHVATFSGCVQLEAHMGYHQALGNCSLLQTLSLASNTLHGRIPRELGNCHDLRLLDLSSNSGLSDRIPLELEALDALGVIRLHTMVRQSKTVAIETHVVNAWLRRGSCAEHQG